MKLVKWLLGAAVVVTALFFGFAATIADRMQNGTLEHEPFEVPAEARALHDDLTLVDWHTDTLLWERPFFKRNGFGHVDLPRLQDGNLGIVMMTAVTKSPAGQNYEENTGDSDRLTLLHIAGLWPTRTWDSLLERALYQADKLDGLISASAGQMQWIKSSRDLEALLRNREIADAAGLEPPIGFLMGAEGGHPLEGTLANVDRMIDAGYRMIGITHFFDNELGGSLHGTEKGGLTDFGRDVVRILNDRNIIIDMAHASEAVAHEVMVITDRPFVVSHTGLKGTCDSPRNYSDETMKAIAQHGGLVAIGYWDGAICDPTPDGIATTIKYAVELLGEDHVAFGSDWDGSTTSLSADEMAAVTEAMLNIGLSEQQIRKIAGGNSIAFLRKWLPRE